MYATLRCRGLLAHRARYNPLTTKNDVRLRKSTLDEWGHGSGRPRFCDDCRLGHNGRSISGFSAVTHRQDCELAAMVVIEHDVAAVTELDRPFAKSVRHLVDRPANPRMRSERPHSLANRADRALRSLSVLRREEGM
jgi:hypothetical protein